MTLLLLFDIHNSIIKCKNIGQYFDFVCIPCWKWTIDCKCLNKFPRLLRFPRGVNVTSSLRHEAPCFFAPGGILLLQAAAFKGTADT